MLLEIDPISGRAPMPGVAKYPPGMNENIVRILLLEDSPSDALLIRETLKEYASHFAVTHVDRLSAAVEHVNHYEVDVVLCDLGLPDASGLEAAQALLSLAPSSVLIVMTRNNDAGTAAAAMRQGAQDYLIKNDICGRTLPICIYFAMERRRTQEIKCIGVDQFEEDPDENGKHS
jgi:DNA-binding NarL/FixJ family response regulator